MRKKFKCCFYAMHPPVPSQQRAMESEAEVGDSERRELGGVMNPHGQRGAKNLVVVRAAAD